jgi:hypothetical protein
LESEPVHLTGAHSILGDGKTCQIGKVNWAVQEIQIKYKHLKAKLNIAGFACYLKQSDDSHTMLNLGNWGRLNIVKNCAGRISLGHVFHVD